MRKEGPSIHRLLQARGHVTIETEEARVVTLPLFTDELFLQRQHMVDCNIERFTYANEHSGDKMVRQGADSPSA